MSRAPEPVPDHEKPASPPAPPQVRKAMPSDHACVPGQRARAHAATNQVLGAAHAWWANCRPASYTLHQHLQNPTINTCNEVENVLARAVAEWILAASIPGTQPGMPFEPRTDEAGNVIGFTRARTPLEAAIARAGLTVRQLARQLELPERALHRWCAVKNSPQGTNRVIIGWWLSEQNELQQQKALQQQQQERQEA